MVINKPRIGQRLGSLVWRLLARYGQLKSRYLLPFYDLFHIGPGHAKPRGTKQPSTTLRAAQALVRRLDRRARHSAGEQLADVIRRVEAANGAVVFLPSIGWEIVNVQRVHHLAREFARRGFVSIFDSSNSYDDVSGFKEIETNLFLFRGEDALLREIPDPILWACTFNFDRRDSYPASTPTVYDWIDELSVFPYERRFLETNHTRALREANLVLSVARRLHEQAIALRPDALYLPNGVDETHFAGASMSLPDDPDISSLLGDGKPVAGFYGALAEWVDYELMEKVARLRPDWNFLLIGPALDLSVHRRSRPLLRRPNVRWIGPRTYESLPAYLQLFDVAMVPFVINEITIATSPLKLYEYFAGAKPVVSTPLPECEAYEEVLIARNADEFSCALDAALGLGRDEQFQERLRRVARENSWPTRAAFVIERFKTMTRRS